MKERTLRLPIVLPCSGSPPRTAQVEIVRRCRAQRGRTAGPSRCRPRAPSAASRLLRGGRLPDAAAAEERCRSPRLQPPPSPDRPRDPAAHSRRTPFRSPRPPVEIAAGRPATAAARVLPTLRPRRAPGAAPPAIRVLSGPARPVSPIAAVDPGQLRRRRRTSRPDRAGAVGCAGRVRHPTLPRRARHQDPLNR